MSGIAGYWNKPEMFPPSLVRCMAADRHVGRSVALTDEQIAERSGLPVSTVQEIYWEKSWDNVTVANMRAFVVACNCDFGDAEVMKVLSKRLGSNSGFKWKHLRESPNFTFYEQLLKHAIGNS